MCVVIYTHFSRVYDSIKIHYIILVFFNLFAYDTSICIETQHGSRM